MQISGVGQWSGALNRPLPPLFLDPGAPPAGTWYFTTLLSGSSVLEGTLSQQAVTSTPVTPGAVSGGTTVLRSLPPSSALKGVLRVLDGCVKCEHLWAMVQKGRPPP